MKTACGNENIQDVPNVNFLRNQPNFIVPYVTGAYTMSLEAKRFFPVSYDNFFSFTIGSQPTQ
jgi:hypothetical protein